MRFKRKIPLCPGFRAEEKSEGVWNVVSGEEGFVVGMIRRNDIESKEKRWQYLPKGGRVPVAFPTFQRVVHWLRSETA